MDHPIIAEFQTMMHFKILVQVRIRNQKRKEKIVLKQTRGYSQLVIFQHAIILKFEISLVHFPRLQFSSDKFKIVR